ncbi:hypothetical protein [Leucobacter coleopterorum]|uniref:hypothetical protein n=1 Tax=Leucobacter coleopterorum TaxID=2714933 RepID=UPI001FCC34BE|nr:hypothetical protein [Leucobacter coleopterorum]
MTSQTLKSISFKMLDDHLSHYAANAGATGGTIAEEKMQEASDAIACLVRS